jgi:hypothetical protein
MSALAHIPEKWEPAFQKRRRLFLSPSVMLEASGAAMIRTSVAIFCLLAVAGCAAATVPTTWTRPDGRAIDPAQLDADKTVCRGEMDQAELVTNARGLAPIYLPGQESPSVKVYNGCMAQHGYAAAR